MRVVDARKIIKTLLQYSSTNTREDGECYGVEVQHYRKTDYKPIIYVVTLAAITQTVTLAVSHLNVSVGRVSFLCLINYSEEGYGPVGGVLVYVFVGFWDGDYVSFHMYFHMCGIMLLLKAVLNMLVRNANPRGPMCFRCLMFNLSGPCELLFLLCVIASWT